VPFPADPPVAAGLAVVAVPSPVVPRAAVDPEAAAVVCLGSAASACRDTPRVGRLGACHRRSLLVTNW
jgi:hypothetical protein